MAAADQDDRKCPPKSKQRGLEICPADEEGWHDTLNTCKEWRRKEQY